MAKPSAEAPRRWAEEPEAKGEAVLAELFRAVGAPPPLSPAALARVHDRLENKRASRMSRRMRELFMAGGMLLLGSSLALAGWGASEWVIGRSQRAPQPAAKTAAPKAAHPLGGAQSRKAKELVVPSPVPDQPAPASDSESDASVEPHAAKARAPLQSAPPSPADSSSLAAEAGALERALVKLRREHDAEGALTVLDESRALLAHGTLALEAQMARVDALLALGRRDEALTILEQLPMARIGRGGELKLMRAELRAVSDCGRALNDFDALVTQALAAPLMERVLYGRAACELQVGDRAHAVQDLNRYLTRFPQGRFAARVQNQLAQLNAKPH